MDNDSDTQAIIILIMFVWILKFKKNGDSLREGKYFVKSKCPNSPWHTQNWDQVRGIVGFRLH